MLTILKISDEEKLPIRVQNALATQQDQSERQIAWTQLVIVLTFIVLYGLSRKMAIAYSSITLVVLVIYLIFTLLCLYTAYRVRLNAWVLSISVFMDFGLLYGLIWTFPLQYLQPPAFYLKAPTLLYVFIFIALRALRFDARYVLLSGAVAIAGWVLMVGYVLMSAQGESMITRDYVHYMTSNSLLLGAEFDKIVSIAVVTIVIAVAINQARQLLTRAVVEGRAKENLSRFFAPNVAKYIGQSGDEITAGSGEVRHVAILNLDLRGFTRLASVLPPQQVMSVLGEYQRAMIPIIQRHGGEIDKFLGDGIMATFGASRPMSDCDAKALDALNDLMRVATEWSAQQRLQRGLELSVNGSAASGPVICGAVGDETRLEYTVIGDAVNLSAKLEKHNKALGCRAVVTADMYDQALAQGHRPTGELRHEKLSRVAGVTEPIDLIIITE